MNELKYKPSSNKITNLFCVMTRHSQFIQISVVILRILQNNTIFQGKSVTPFSYCVFVGSSNPHDYPCFYALISQIIVNPPSLLIGRSVVVLIPSNYFWCFWHRQLQKVSPPSKQTVSVHYKGTIYYFYGTDPIQAQRRSRVRLLLPPARRSRKPHLVSCTGAHSQGKQGIPVRVSLLMR